MKDEDIDAVIRLWCTTTSIDQMADAIGEDRDTLETVISARIRMLLFCSPKRRGKGKKKHG